MYVLGKRGGKALVVGLQVGALVLTVYLTYLLGQLTGPTPDGPVDRDAGGGGGRDVCATKDLGVRRDQVRPARAPQKVLTYDHNPTNS